MSIPYRPGPEQLRLFEALGTEVRQHGPEYLSAAAWFGREFSLKAIDARKEADLTPQDRAFREAWERAGGVFPAHRDPSGYMERLLRATEYLIEIDDSALPKADRLEHYRRAVLVGALMTNPDIHEEAPDLAKALAMDRSHWPTAKELTVGSDGDVALDRWWARDVVFDADYRGYQSFQPLLERALKALQHERGRDQHASEPKESAPTEREFQPAGFFPKKMHARLRHAAASGRRTKKVETRTEDGVVFYCVEDARKWWPNDCPRPGP